MCVPGGFSQIRSHIWHQYYVKIINRFGTDTQTNTRTNIHRHTHSTQPLNITDFLLATMRDTTRHHSEFLCSIVCVCVTQTIIETIPWKCFE